MPTVDYALFNELSAIALADSAYQAQTWIIGLVDVMRDARNLGFRRIRTRDDFRFQEIAIGASVADILKGLDRDRRVLMYSLLSSPYLDEKDEIEFVANRVVSLNGDTDADPEGVLCAHLVESLAVSLDSDERWNSDLLRCELRRDESQVTRSANVPHASRTAHLRSHVPWAVRRMGLGGQLPPSRDKPLPNTRWSDLLVDDDWSNFYETTSQLVPAEKTARLTEMSHQVAFINGYNYCERRSAKNGQGSGALRKVFVSVFSQVGQEVFLSTDFEKAAGAFEVYDQNGRHLGEWLFSGVKDGGPDMSGSHDILV